MRVAVIAPEDPGERLHGGTMRTAAFLRAFGEYGHDTQLFLPRVTATPAADGRSRPPTTLSRIKREWSPMPTALGVIRKFASDLRSRLSGYDLVLFSNFENRILVPRQVRTRVWFDQADVHSRYALSESTYRVRPACLGGRVQAQWLQRREHAWARAAPVTTAAGFGDATYASGPHATVHWLPNPVDVRDVAVVDPPGTRTAGFLGNFSYAPNVAAYDTLVNEWLPNLRRRGWDDIVVAGYGSEDLPRVDGVTLLGGVDEVADFYAAIDLALCPVERGGGMKVKAIEALCHGRPVLASVHTADGFPPDVADLLAVLRNGASVPTPDEAQLPVAATHLIREIFSMDAFVARVGELLEAWPVPLP